MTTYENAPATKLLATHCAVCALPLVDAKSVETGMGPVCRKKHGFNIAVSDTARKEANTLVYRIAALRSLCEQGQATWVQVGIECLQGAATLATLGFTVLSAILTDRLATIRLVEVSGTIKVFTPYRASAVDAFRAIPGRRWSAEDKCNTVPATGEAKVALLRLLQAHYSGQLAVGSKGPFIVGQPLQSPVMHS